jgi:hypothetical protein
LESLDKSDEKDGTCGDKVVGALVLGVADKDE